MVSFRTFVPVLGFCLLPVLCCAQSGEIRLSVKDRRLDLLVDEALLAKRRATSTTTRGPSRGYRRLYMDHVLQADHGCDFDFLRKGPIG